MDFFLKIKSQEIRSAFQKIYQQSEQINLNFLLTYIIADNLGRYSGIFSQESNEIQQMSNNTNSNRSYQQIEIILRIISFSVILLSIILGRRLQVWWNMSCDMIVLIVCTLQNISWIVATGDNQQFMLERLPQLILQGLSYSVIGFLMIEKVIIRMVFLLGCTLCNWMIFKQDITVQLVTNYVLLTTFFTIVNFILYRQEKQNKIYFISTYNMLQKEKEFAKLLNLIPGGICILDKNFQLLYQNSVLNEIFQVETQVKSAKEETEIIKSFMTLRDLKIRNSSSKQKESLRLLSKKLSFNVKLEQMFSQNSQSIQSNDNFGGGHMTPTEHERNMTFQEILQLLQNPDYQQHSEFISFDTKYKINQGQENTNGNNNELNNQQQQELMMTNRDTNMINNNTQQQTRSLEIKLKKTQFNQEDATIFIVTDISEREKLVILEEANTFKDNLISSISHELRTPVNCVKNFINTAIQSQMIPVQLINELLQPSLQCLMLLTSMINDLLDYSLILRRNFKLNLEYFDIRQQLENVVQILYQQASVKQIRLSYNIDKGISTLIKTDQHRLQQVLLNLVGNSLKFTTGGSIKINVSQQMNARNQLKISVSDTGIGMSEIELHRLKTNLSKLNNLDKVSGSSTGANLGLSISHLITKYLCKTKAGGLQIDSIQHTGSVFSFLLYNYDTNKPKEGGGDIDKFSQIKEEEEELENDDCNDSITTMQNQLQKINSSFLQLKNPLQYSPLLQSPLRSNKNMLQPNLLLSFPATSSQFDNNSSTISNGGSGGERVYQLDTDNIRKNLLLKQQWQSQQQQSSLFGGGSGISQYQLTKTLLCKCSPILIVDDHEFNLISLKKLLKCSLDLECDLAFNGDQAIKKVLQRVLHDTCGNYCKPYKIIIMDCNMPIIDGYVATKILKEKINKNEIPNIHIIAHTAYCKDNIDKQFKEAGFDGFLPKPFNLKELKDKVLPYFQ